MLQSEYSIIIIMHIHLLIFSSAGELII